MTDPRVRWFSLVTAVFLAGCPEPFEFGNPPCTTDPDCHPNVLGPDFVGYRCRQARCVLRNCGNATVDPGEECDDGNEEPDDGCDHTCTLRAIPLPPDAGPLRDVGLSDGGGSDAGLDDAGPLDAGPEDTGFSVLPDEQCSVAPAVFGRLRVGTAPGADYTPLPDIELTGATVTQSAAHRLSPGQDGHGCIGMVQLRLEVAPQCSLMAFFRAGDAGLNLETATFTASAGCPQWPVSVAGTWRLRAEDSRVWLSQANSVPGTRGGRTCFGPDTMAVGGAARMYSVGQPDLIVDFDAVKVVGALNSNGQGGEPPLVCSATCGDGVVSEPEACDDGNHDDGDGCGSGCHTECHARQGISGLPPFDFGADFTVEAWLHADGASGLLSAHGLTVEAGQTLRFGWGDDVLTTTLETPLSGWNHVAFAYRRELNRRRVFLNGTPLAEDIAAGPYLPAMDQEPAVAATVGALRVSSLERYAGAFVPRYPFNSDGDTQVNYDMTSAVGPLVDGSGAKRHANLGQVVDDCPVAPTCGDGNLELGELCDDGNIEAGDGCNELCRPEGCGDGRLDPGEGCDDGNRFDTDACRNDCSAARCGDGIRRSDLGAEAIGFEACDDGNEADDDACTNTCLLPRCGDGIQRLDLEPGAPGYEACDDGNAVDTDACRADCSLPRCGDGVLRRDLVAGLDGFEECDDGNAEAGDGCNAQCQTEQCGNGRVDPGEACDDGNLVHTDACRNDCLAARCGDGLRRGDIGEGVEGYEACDDGNEDDTDACLSNCLEARCGDAIVRVDLQRGDIGYEACDDGNQVDDDDCSNDCSDRRRHQVDRVYAGRANGLICGRTRSAQLRCRATDNGYGVIGRGDLVASETPVLVPNLNGVVDVAVGDDHVCAVLETGVVRCWGANYVGQIGDSTIHNRPSPTTVVGLVGATAISAGTDTTCALIGDGTVRCWGGNTGGVLGIGSNDQQLAQREAAAVQGLTRVDQLAINGDTACAKTSTGFVFCWGGLPFGSMYQGGGGPRVATSPVLLQGVFGANEVVPGSNFICLRMAEDSQCWGSNADGQSGVVAGAQPVYQPHAVTGTLGAAAMASNLANACVIMGNGNLHCWGAGFSHEANPVPGITDVVSVSRFGTSGYCVSTSDYAVRCFEPGGAVTPIEGW